MKLFFSKTLAAGLLTVAAGTASAAPALFDFGNLTYYNAAGSFMPVAGGHSCTGGDACSALGGSMTYQVGSISVAAWGYNTAQNKSAYVVQDHDGNTGAGLGVYRTLTDTSDDNVQSGELLRMTFNQVVNLSSAVFAAEGHTPFANSKTLQYKVDGGSWTSAGLAAGLSNLHGTTFSFRTGGAQPDEFYLNAMTVTTAVPEPETFAMMLAGLGLMGAIARRRKAQPA